MPTGLGDEKLWLSATNDNTGSSTAFDDLSGNGNDGTANGGMLVVADTSEGGTYAFDFDGTNDYIDTGTGIAPTGDLSISAWVNSSSFPANSSDRHTIIEKAYDSGDEPFTFVFAGTTELRSYSYDGTLHGITGYSHGMSTNAWYHVATTFDGATWKMFVNGTQVATANDSTSLLQNALETLVGASTVSGAVSRFFDGKMDDIRLYYRALTQAEITHLASSRGVEGPPPVGLGDEQLWLCPSLNDSANDLSGNGNDGNYQGGMGTQSVTGKGGSLAYYAPTRSSSSDYVSVPSGVLIDNNDANLSLWFQQSGDLTSGNTGNYAIIEVYEFKVVFYQTSLNRVRFGIIPTGGFVNKDAIAQRTYEANHWDHLSINYDHASVTATAYVNGVSVGSVTSSGTIALSNEIRIFRAGQGYVDDVRAYTRQLTQAEITHLASSRGIEGGPSTPTTQYNPFITHAFKQLFQQRLR